MIEINISGKKYTLEEAQELYSELKKIFEKEEKKDYIPFPVYPDPYHIFPQNPRYDKNKWEIPQITCGSVTGDKGITIS